MKLSALQNWKEAIQSPITLKEYTRKLNNYAKFFEITNWDTYLTKGSDDIHSDLELFISEQKKKGIKNITIKGYLNSIFLMMDMNRVVVFKKIHLNKLKKDGKMVGGGTPYTADEIFRMVKSTPTLRIKALILFLSSTGIRPAGLTDPPLRIKHLQEIENCYCVTIYSESDQSYFVFLTPESRNALDQYLESRKLNGEKLTDESPLFANVIDRYGSIGEPITNDSISAIMNRVIKKAGIQKNKNGNRFDKALSYGMRKYFNGKMKLNKDVNSNVAEKMIGHSKTHKLDSVYFAPTIQECFAEFKKIIPELTIDPTNRQKIQIEKLIGEKTELEKEKQHTTELEQRLREFENTQMKMMELIQSGRATLENFKDNEIRMKLSATTISN